jgi:hypothetical protein
MRNSFYDSSTMVLSLIRLTHMKCSFRKLAGGNRDEVTSMWSQELPRRNETMLKHCFHFCSLLFLALMSTNFTVYSKIVIKFPVKEYHVRQKSGLGNMVGAVSISGRVGLYFQHFS